MKLEEVLPHLRNGGRVELNGFIYNFDDLQSINPRHLMLTGNFEIVKGSYKKEHIVEFFKDNEYLVDKDDSFFLYKIFPDKNNKTYKVTIEEIDQ